jgi:hypothetical protein
MITTTTTKRYSVPSGELRITPDMLLRGLGYKRRAVPPSLHAALDEVLSNGRDIADVQCGFVMLPPGYVTIGEADATFDSRQLKLGSIIADRLREAQALAVFVATAGPEIERWASALMKSGDVIKGYVADALGSETAELAAEWLEHKIAEIAAAEGWLITNRYSPGYCGWPTSDQHTLFSLLPPDFCGIRLTDSALMLPVKSVSGVIGLGPGVRREGYQCAICELQDCFRRKDDNTP